MYAYTWSFLACFVLVCGYLHLSGKKREHPGNIGWSIGNDVTVAAVLLAAAWALLAYSFATWSVEGLAAASAGLVLLLSRPVKGRIVYHQLLFPDAVAGKQRKFSPLPEAEAQSSRGAPLGGFHIKPGETLLVQNGGIVLVDGILVKGEALIDYSLVNGISAPVRRYPGEVIYAGGRQLSGLIELLPVNEGGPSLITALWKSDDRSRLDKSPILSPAGLSSCQELMSCTLLFMLLSAIWMYMNIPDKGRILIVAGVLVSCMTFRAAVAFFLDKRLLRGLRNNGLWLRNTRVIDAITEVDHILFDKTGTLTYVDGHAAVFCGEELTAYEKACIASLAASSSHPSYKAIWRCCDPGYFFPVDRFENIEGPGIAGHIHSMEIRLFAPQPADIEDRLPVKASIVQLSINGVHRGAFHVTGKYRKGIRELLNGMKTSHALSLLTGDNNRDAGYLRNLMGETALLRFYQRSSDKAGYVGRLQQAGQKVLMIGDGPDDEEAIKMSNVGLLLVENIYGFLPACDGILLADKLFLLGAFIRLCRVHQCFMLVYYLVFFVADCSLLAFAIQEATGIQILIMFFLIQCTGLVLAGFIWQRLVMRPVPAGSHRRF